MRALAILAASAVYVLPQLLFIEGPYHRFIAMSGRTAYLSNFTFFALGMALGCFLAIVAFRSWARIAWLSLYSIYIIAISASAVHSWEWPVWRPFSSDWTAAFQLLWLSVVPAQLLLFRLGLPVPELARRAVQVALIIQLLAAIAQLIV